MVQLWRGDLEGDTIQALKRAIFERGPFISLNGDVTVVRSVGDLQDVTFFLSLLGLLASPPRSIGQQSPFEGNLPFLALFGFCSAGLLLNIGFDTYVHQPKHCQTRDFQRALVNSDWMGLLS